MKLSISDEKYLEYLYVIKPDDVSNFNDWYDNLSPNDTVTLIGKIKYDLIKSKTHKNHALHLDV